MSTSQSRPPQQLFNRKKRQRIQYEFSLNRYFPPFNIQQRQKFYFTWTWETLPFLIDFCSSLINVYQKWNSYYSCCAQLCKYCNMALMSKILFLKIQSNPKFSIVSFWKLFIAITDYLDSQHEAKKRFCWVNKDHRSQLHSTNAYNILVFKQTSCE